MRRYIYRVYYKKYQGDGNIVKMLEILFPYLGSIGVSFTDSYVMNV